MSEHHNPEQVAEIIDQLTDAARPATMGATRDSEERAEWREWIGQKLMTTMLCTHEFERAVCETCFENTQRVGRLIEDELEKRTAAEPSCCGDGCPCREAGER